MADQKISALNAVVTPLGTDVLPDVQFADVNVETKKISLSQIQTFALTDGTVTNTLTIPDEGLKLQDTDASDTLIFKVGSNLTADRIFTITTGDAARTVTFSGNPTLDDWFDQSVKTTATPRFVALNLDDNGGDHTVELAIADDVTGNRELKFDMNDANRTITFSGSPTLDDWFDQSVKTTASPTFVTPVVTSLDIKDSGGDHNVTLDISDDQTANRALNFALGDSDRTITLSGNPTLNDWFDQDVKTTASPTHATLNLSANLAFTGTGNEITGDFSNATLANRVTFKTSTTNGSTELGGKPDGTGTASSLTLYDANDTANAGLLSLTADSSFASVKSSKNGTGTTQDLSIGADSNVVTFNAAGNVDFTDPIAVSTTNHSFVGPLGSIDVEVYATQETLTGSIITASRNQTGTSGANLSLLKSRGTESSPTIVSNGDEVGQIAFLAYDGVNYELAAYISATMAGTPGSDDVPCELQFYTCNDGAKVASLAHTIHEDHTQTAQQAYNFALTTTASDVNSAKETIIGVTSTAAPRTITLDSDDVVAGRIIIVKDQSGGAGTNNITIDTEGAETIDGAASIAITANYGAARLYSDGTNWFEI